MSNLKFLKQIERIELAHEIAKKIAIASGTKPEQFAEVDKKLSELKELAKSKVQGGVIVVKSLMDELDDNERSDIMSNYCQCGSKNIRCQCWNDE